MLPFAAVFVVAGAVTFAVTPPIERLARRLGAVDLPAESRKVHVRPIPTLGGLALLAGFASAMGVAWLLAQVGLDAGGSGQGPFAAVFRATSEPLGLALGVLVIAVVGVFDDTRGLSPPVKLGGQALAALMVVLQGIQVVYAWIPGVGVVVLSPDLGVPLTVLFIVAMINAVNFIDGLDGLAAGVSAISATAFFWFVHAAETRGIAESAPTSATLVAAAIAGMSLGFLWHNFHPARIFMGDTGSMMLGLLLASSGIAFVGRSVDPSYVDFLTPVPLLIPAFILAIPFADILFAIVRRVYRHQPVSTPDRGHLHHRLLRFGVTHRQAVLTLYYWSAVAAFGSVGVAYLDVRTVLVVVILLAVGGALATAAGLRRAGANEADEGMDHAGGQRRSG
ncbi:MAG: undecaprenyl/decaprenyl-phosphate alpha-N-acetylglucosaminyl 1-phosphate transferase [Actinobacteria bacterium]|nr:undecaprenyl/decaprenyl-phosphate alpha-N-acetylglucosaminyl 1-phosphate transferase [Actinomycetota bacterium]